MFGAARRSLEVVAVYHAVVFGGVQTLPLPPAVFDEFGYRPSAVSWVPTLVKRVSILWLVVVVVVVGVVVVVEEVVCHLDSMNILSMSNCKGRKQT